MRESIRDRLVWKKGMKRNQEMIDGRLEMQLDFFFNVFSREEE